MYLTKASALYYMNNFCVNMTISKSQSLLVNWLCTTQYMQNNLKNSLHLIHYGNVQRVICHIVNKEKGIVPDIDAFSHTPLGILLNRAQTTSPSKDTLANRNSRT